MSFDPQDVLNDNNVEGQSKMGKALGWKTGRVRAMFSATGGAAIGSHNLVGLDGVTTITIPKGATITRALYKVLTTFTSATDAGTIALQVVGANDVTSAVAISNGANPWDAADLPVAGTPVTHTLSTWLTNKTADVTPKAVVAVEALTAGKLIVWLEYVYWGDVPVT